MNENAYNSFITIHDNIYNTTHNVMLSSIDAPEIASSIESGTPEYKAEVLEHSKYSVLGLYKEQGPFSGSPNFKFFKLSEFGSRYTVLDEYGKIKKN